MTRERQLAFTLPHRAARGRDDFLVSASNGHAVAAIDGWPGWPDSQLLMLGPPGSGKSHLVEVWRARSGARRFSALDIDAAAVAAVGEAAAIVVEDLQPDIDQPVLFHLLNEVRRSGTDMLMTARMPPTTWPGILPDLASRLARIPVISLAAPDDALMGALLAKLFADRQIEVEPPVVQYLSLRLERSFAALQSAVDELDRLSFEERRPVTRALAARILASRGVDGDI